MSVIAISASMKSDFLLSAGAFVLVENENFVPFKEGL